MPHDVRINFVELKRNCAFFTEFFVSYITFLLQKEIFLSKAVPFRFENKILFQRSYFFASKKKFCFKIRTFLLRKQNSCFQNNFQVLFQIKWFIILTVLPRSVCLVGGNYLRVIASGQHNSFRRNVVAVASRW